MRGLTSQDGRTTAVTVLVWLVALGVVLRLASMAAWTPALLGNFDTPLYLTSAANDLFSDPGRPAGYPLFLRGLHALYPSLSLLVLAQHLLGVCTALLLFSSVRRVVSDGWALLPAAIVLLAGPQLFHEQAVLSEPLFAFLLAALCYCCVRALESNPLAWGSAAGLLAAAAACVRAVGLLFVGLAVVWLVAAVPAPALRRLAIGGAATLAAALVIGAYAASARHEAGYVGPGLTRVGGLHTYSSVAPFADCGRFTPPPGTRGLCERRAPADRPGPFWYQPPPFRFFAGGPITPEQDRQLSAFARTVVLHQPLDYLRDRGAELTRFWSSDLHHANGLDSESYGVVRTGLSQPIHRKTGRVLREWYGNPKPKIWNGAWDALSAYERRTRLEGPVFVLLVLLALAGLPLARGQRLKVGLLLAGAAMAALVGPVVLTYYDARFAIPGYGLLGAAAAIGAAGLWERAVAWRASRHDVLTAREGAAA